LIMYEVSNCKNYILFSKVFLLTLYIYIFFYQHFELKSFNMNFMSITWRIINRVAKTWEHREHALGTFDLLRKIWAKGPHLDMSQEVNTITHLILDESTLRTLAHFLQLWDNVTNVTQSPFIEFGHNLKK
jgi:hypothetical protein